MEKQTFTLIGSVDGINVDMEQPITKNQINFLDCQMLAEQQNCEFWYVKNDQTYEQVL